MTPIEIIKFIALLLISIWIYTFGYILGRWDGEDKK